MSIMRRLICLLACWASLAFGQEIPIQLTLVPTDDGHQETMAFDLNISIEEGWKIFGPVQASPATPKLAVVWETLENVKDITLAWPTGAQHQIQQTPIQVYTHNVVATGKAHILETRAPHFMKATVTSIACHKTKGCLPFQQSITFGQNNSLVPVSFWMELALMIGISILGGLILNIMPCVLPVLFLKLNHLIRAREKEKVHVQQQFFFAGLGIMVFFGLSGFLMALLNSSGQSVGWGMHFQSPIFLGLLWGVLVVFAANLWGRFEITLPQFLMNKMGSFMAHQRSSSFFEGMFAALLATPCSAPFLGTAIAFALGQSPWVTCIIFLSLGFGLSLPYFLISFVPQIARIFPKPGNWMNSLKYALAFMLLLTALWILWVLTAHMRPAGLWCLILLGVCLWTFIKKQPFLGQVILLLAFLGTIQWSVSYYAHRVPEVAHHELTHDLIQAYVEDGKTVLVVVTADWCLTCKATDRLVLQDPEVVSFLTDEGVVFLKADWTTRDESIRLFMKHYHRFGIPFVAAFGPRMPQGVLLPEYYTKDQLLTALKKAKGRIWQS